MHKSDLTLPAPESENEAAQVREQLERLLAHPLFCQSKRYPAMLRYTVEQTMLGNGDQLKERNIGIEVFGRKPDYDTNSDPIVRFAASEIRKRLAQYYVDPAHASELKIDLPGGSYVAVIDVSVHESASVESEAYLRGEDFNFVAASVVSPQTTQEMLPDAPLVQAPVAVSPSRRKMITWALLFATLSGAIGICVGLWLHSSSVAGWPAYSSSNPLDQFWSPVIAAPGTVTLCLGSFSPNGQIEDGAAQIAISGNNLPPLFNQLIQSDHLATMAIADVVTLTRMGAALDARNKPYRVSTAFHITFSQLREGPVILIGSYSNPWTDRLTKTLRFNFLFQNGIGSIVDHRGFAQIRWSMPLDTTFQKFTHDYALIARIHNSTTGQPVVLVAGITDEGTQAAGEALSNPSYFAELVKQAPSNWSAMNMEAVIETQVIDGQPGPPHTLAVEFW